MTPQFNTIYENLYADYVYEADLRHRFLRYDEYQLLKIIRRSIDTSDSTNRLRSDAKYFLLVNFHNLIVRPMIENYRYEFRDETKIVTDLEKYIIEDIQTIIITTTNVISTDEEPISGHRVMSTINDIWRTLKTTSLEIWG